MLVIEDDSTFAAILLDLAHELQYRCVVARSGTEALQLADQHLPDAILLDIGLPDRSGLVVLQELKDDASDAAHSRAYRVRVRPDEAALHLGAVGYALKPTTRDALKEIFRGMENRLKQKLKRVLLVEDDARQREGIVAVDPGRRCRDHRRRTGQEALDLLRTTVFDCMIIDLKLPDMQGGELLQRMTTAELRSFPPVIVYTGRSLTTRRGDRTIAVLAVDHHQGRAFARAAAG